MIAGLPVISAAGQKTNANSKYAIVHNFVGGNDGLYPYGGLILDSSGNLYGTTLEGGGTGNYGVVFEIKNGVYEKVLHEFGAGTDGQYPFAGVVRDSQGNLYGSTNAGGTYGGGAVYEISASGTESVLYNFTGGTDGNTPDAAPTLGTDGRIYGTTRLGGAYNFGTVYAVDTTGTESVIHDFLGNNGVDGGDPWGGVVSDGNGTLYGMTFYGGIMTCPSDYLTGCGVIYKVTETGNETVLYAFTDTKDGLYPAGDLVRDSAGNLYGVDQGQGKGDHSKYGAIFKLDPTGKLTVLHNFTGGWAGQTPWGGLTIDANGNLYGTTANGGGAACFLGCGTVFEFSNTGKFTVLHRFKSFPDGANPQGKMVIDGSGNLYGTTMNGGEGGGVVFKITP